jgi:hypothetical protein
VGGVAEGAQAPAQTDLRVYPITPVGVVAEGAQAPAQTDLRVYPTAPVGKVAEFEQAELDNPVANAEQVVPTGGITAVGLSSSNQRGG